MAWVLFWTYYYNKLWYFTLSQKKHYADRPRNIGIYGILQQDKKYERLDSIPVRVTISISRKSFVDRICGFCLSAWNGICSLFVLYFQKIKCKGRKSGNFRLFAFAEIQLTCHSVGHFRLRLLKHMTIDVAGRAYAGMTQRSRNRHNINTLIDKQGAEQVSETMQTIKW